MVLFVVVCVRYGTCAVCLWESRGHPSKTAGGGGGGGGGGWDGVW